MKRICWALCLLLLCAAPAAGQWIVIPNTPITGPLTSCTIAAGPTQCSATASAGALARVADNIRGVWIYNGAAWVSLTGRANLTDFGSKCDDTGAGLGTDDTAAITLAWNAVTNAGGGDIFVPGKCTWTALSLPILNNYVPVNFVGVGPTTSQLVQRAGVTGTFTLTTTGQVYWPAHWRDLAITCSNNTNTNGCLSLPAVYNGLFMNMVIGYTTTTALTLGGTEVFDFLQVKIQNAATCVAGTRPGAFSPNLITFSGGAFATCSTWAINADHATGWKLDHLNMIGNGTSGNNGTGVILFTNASSDASAFPWLTVDDVWFELSGGNAEIQGLSVPAFSSLTIRNTIFGSGRATTGPQYSVYVTGGSVGIYESPVVCAGCNGGHFYTASATGTVSTTIQNSRISYLALDPYAMVQPYPTTGVNAMVLSAGELVLKPPGVSGVKAQLYTRNNGDNVGPQDNIPKNGSAGNWTTNVAGNLLALAAAGLSSPPDVSWGCAVALNSTGTPLTCTAGYTSGVNITWTFYNATTGAAFDVTAGLGGGEIDVDFTYRKQ